MKTPDLSVFCGLRTVGDLLSGNLRENKEHCIYAVFDEQGGCLYVGKATSGVSSRFFNGMTPHIYTRFNGKGYFGGSRIGTAICNRLPQSGAWPLLLLTPQDCLPMATSLAMARATCSIATKVKLPRRLHARILNSKDWRQSDPRFPFDCEVAAIAHFAPSLNANHDEIRALNVRQFRRGRLTPTCQEQAKEQALLDAMRQE